MQQLSQQMRFAPGYGQGSGSQRSRFNRRPNRRQFRGTTYGSGAISGSDQSSRHSSAGSVLLLIRSVVEFIKVLVTFLQELVFNMGSLDT